MADDLTALGEVVTYRTLVLNVLRGLNERFTHIGALLRRARPFPTFLQVKDDLSLEELTLGSCPPSPAVALAATTKSASHSGTGNGAGSKPNRRGKRGSGGGGGSGGGSGSGGSGGPTQQQHTAQQQHMPQPQQLFQPQLQPYQLPAAPPGASEVGQWGLAGSYNPMAGLPSWDTQSLASAFSTATLNQPSSSEWYFDSGASSHMTSTPHSLSQTFSQRYPAPSIIVGNGSMIPVTATGTTELPHSLRLNNILVSPQIIKNLIFVRQFTTDNNCSIEFNPAGCSVKDLNSRNVIVRCNSSGPLYPLRLNPAHSLVAKDSSPL
jgi:hypothetical protein